MRIDKRVLTIAASIVFGCLSIWLFTWLNQTNESATSAYQFSTQTSEAKEQLQVAEVIVDVVGAVKSPGVVTLPAGSRVMDAIAAAGGMKPGKAAGINLARILNDGEQIVVGQTSAGSDSNQININTADESQLESLPGVGPVMASRIVQYRNENGPFKKIADIDAVSGVGESVLSQISPLITVG